MVDARPSKASFLTSWMILLPVAAWKQHQEGILRFLTLCLNLKKFQPMH
jgi:hypothetical protein